MRSISVVFARARRSKRRALKSPSAGFAPEKHPEREIWMIAAGSGRLHYRGEVTDVRSGDCLTFDPNTEHSVHNTGTEPMRIFSVWWTERAP